VNNSGLATVVDRLVAELPPNIIDGVVTRLESAPSPLPKGRLTDLASLPQSRQLLADLESALVAEPAIDQCLVGLAIRTSRLASERARRRNSLEIAWTGPGTGAVPVRRVDQVVYEMIAGAQQSVLLVTYVAYGAERLLDELKAAVGRGVKVSMVLERVEDSAGKLEFDGLAKIRARLPAAQIYCWPVDQRPANSSGKTGTLHAKCLVCDEQQVLVSSANLTDYALELNMELGLRVSGEDVPARIAGHFKQLMVQRVLKRVE
jgi:phosphatidylserine/phosphatidylglycerophosphate/cardiolipin synthase-like enzyme